MDKQEPKRYSLRLGADVQQLVPQRGSVDVRLSPESEVLCIHRGTEPIEDMHDSQPFRIMPGYFKTQYAAAVHFKARSIVPGSRNPETSRQASFIAIIGTVDFRADGSFSVTRQVDHPDEWAPFSEDERAEYEGHAEALDRDGMVNAIDPSVEIVSTSSVQSGKLPGKGSRIRGTADGAARPVGGTGRRANARPDIHVSDPAALEPIPAEENSTLQEINADRGAAEAAGHRTR